MVKKGVILGIGNPLLDIQANVPMSVLEKYDLKPANAILAEDKHLPLVPELVENYEVEYVAGGATQNSIRVAQWLLKEKDATAFIGCVGNDKNMETLKNAAESSGVKTHYLIDEKPTGTCACLINDSERSLVANLSAANEYKHSHFETPEIQKVVSNADIFYISSFFLTVSPQTAVAVGKYAADNKKIFAMNLAAPFLLEVPPLFSNVEEMIPYADFVFGNETEGAALGKAKGWGEDLKEIALKLSEEKKANEERKRVAIITQGSGPAIIAIDGKISEHPVIPCPKENLVDLNGAGDSWVGGFLSQLAQGKEIEDCVRAANYCANIVIQRSGCTVNETPEFE